MNDGSVRGCRHSWSKLIAAKHNQRTAFDRLDTLLLRLLHELLIFGTGIENDALRIQTEDIIHMLRLAMRPNIQGHRVDVLHGGLLKDIQDLLSKYRPVLNADRDDLVIVFRQHAGGQIGVATLIRRGADYDCFLHVFFCI